MSMRMVKAFYKFVFIFISLFFLNMGIDASVKPALRDSSTASTQEITSLKTSHIQRTFEGYVGKDGYVRRLFSQQPYFLHTKKQPIARLQFRPEDVKMAEIFLNKKVIVKGTPEYANKEPYLLIHVEDLCEIK